MKNRIGERRIMSCGEEAEIVKYNGALDIIVRFIKTGELVNSTYNHFKNKSIKSHFTPTVYGVGIVGLENIIDDNKKTVGSYKAWCSMLERCYSEKLKDKYQTYKDCKVCDEWLYYKNFKEWYNKKYYEIEGQKMELDKDILNKDNKIYSPETCVFVPHSINSLFIKCNASRGNLPIGVSWHKPTNQYRARCNIFDINKEVYVKGKHLGLYNTPKEAFNTYKKIKEENIKQTADYYKGKIPKKLYNAMYRYKVEIDD